MAWYMGQASEQGESVLGTSICGVWEHFHVQGMGVYYCFNSEVYNHHYVHYVHYTLFHTRFWIIFSKTCIKVHKTQRSSSQKASIMRSSYSQTFEKRSSLPPPNPPAGLL